MSNSHEFDEVVDCIDVLQLLSEYDSGVVDKGPYWLFNCPACGKREAYWYKDGSGYKCNRLSKCGVSGTIWDMVALVDRVERSDTKELYLALKKRAGLYEEHGVIKLTPDNAKKEIAKYCESLLTSDARAVPALDYLRGRGYTGDQTKAMRFGFLPPWQEVKKHLLDTGYKSEDIADIGIDTKPFGSSHVLLIPYRSADTVKGFIARTIGADEPKYLYNTGLKRDALFGLKKAQAGSMTPLVICEGFIDALRLQQNGLKTACAIGGASLTVPMIDDAVLKGHRRAVLCFDNDAAGQSATADAVLKLCRKGVECYVADWSNGSKDPDEQMKTPEGAKKIADAVRDAQRGSRWLAGQRVKAAGILSDMVADEIMESAIRDALTFKDPHDKRLLVEEIGKGIFLTQKEIELKWREFITREHERKELETKDAQLSELKPQIDKILNAINEKDIEAVREIVSDANRRLDVKVKDSLVITPDIEAVRQEILRMGEGIASGYDEIDKYTRFPSSALTVVAARPSHGKTVFLLNLFRNALMDPQNAGKAFVYWTLEENALSNTAPKIISILSAEDRDVKPFDPDNHLFKLRYYLSHFENMQKSTKAEWIRPNVNRGIQLYRDLVASQRMKLGDRVYRTDQMRAVIDEVMRTTEMGIGGVFVDYVQKAKAASSTEIVVRQVELAQVSRELLDITKDYCIPGVIAAQFGRQKDKKDVVSMSNLRECGDIEQDASLVIGIWNPSMDMSSKDDAVRKDRFVNIEITPLKARESGFMSHGSSTLTLDRAYGKVWGRKKKEELSEDDNPFVKGELEYA